MKSRTSMHVIIFIIAVLVSGWLGVLVDRLLPEQPEGDSLGMGLWLVFPLLTVVALQLMSRSSWRGMGLALHFKRSWRWYIVALLIYPLITAIVLAIGKAAGWTDLSELRLESFLSVFLSLILVSFIKNIFEELVWRGYLTGKLVEKKLNDWSIYLIVGLVWGLWHLPYYMVFLSEESMYNVLPVSRVVFAIVAVISMTAWTVMFVELYRISGSIWPCVLMHAVEDSLLNHLVIDGYISIISGKEIWISPISGIITSLLYVAVGLLIRFIRLRQIPRTPDASFNNQHLLN